jgi:hypothetical protein
LAAIFYAHRAEGAATLDQIIGYGDAINHAIFKPEEIESGFARLVSAGLLTETAGALAPAGKAIEWYEEFQQAPITNVGSIDWVSKRLGAESYRAGRDPRNDLEYPGFTRAQYEAAYRAYSERAAAILQQLRANNYQVAPSIASPLRTHATESAAIHRTAGNLAAETTRSSASVSRVFSWVGALLSLLSLAELLWYLHQNQSNHTAFDPWLLSILFVPTTIAGVIYLSRVRTFAAAGILALTVGILGLAVLFYIDHTNRMLQYERWLQRGMPVRRK